MDSTYGIKVQTLDTVVRTVEVKLQICGLKISIAFKVLVPAVFLLACVQPLSEDGGRSLLAFFLVDS